MTTLAIEMRRTLRELHARMIANAGGEHEVECDEEFRLAMKEHAPALLDEVARLLAEEEAAMAWLSDLDECPERLSDAAKHAVQVLRATMQIVVDLNTENKRLKGAKE